MSHRSPRNMVFTRTLQAWTAAISCAVLLVSSVGLPLPTIATKDGSKPFPCLKRACGCQTADDCWKKCCCFTDEEKLAWARENGVTPPDEVVARVAARRNQPIEITENSGSCCHHAKKSCCHEAEPESTSNSCCHTNKSAKVPDVSSSTEVKFVVAMEAAKCSGVHLSWICVKTGMTPPTPVFAPNSTIGLVTWFDILDIESDSLLPEPVAPPPKILSLA